MIKDYMHYLLGSGIARPLPSATERESVAHRDAGPPPKMQPASVVLQTGLERAALQFHDREQALLREIADREAELSDVRRAASAAMAALMELATDDALEGAL